MKTVAALYIDPKGPYPSMPDVEAWDQARDARQYAGPHPVVAHPPCGPWGKLRHMYQGNQHDCALRAVDQVRAFGGVLEHPAHSLLWRQCHLPWPGELAFDGFSVAVDQCAFGHVARKRTWLYVVGAPRSYVEDTKLTGGTPTHWISGGRGREGKKAHTTPVPHGIKVCSPRQRRLSPPLFAQWLVDIARQVA